MRAAFPQGVREEEAALTRGLTTVQTARAARGLRWAGGRLFEILGTWAGEANHPSIAVSMATASRHLGWHLEDLDELVPDSVLLADDTAFEPPDAVGAALDAIRAIPGAPARLGVAHRVLLARMASRCVRIQRLASPHADAPFTRIVEFLLADIRRDRDDGEVLLERLLLDELAVNQVGERVVEAERRLVVAGGLFTDGLD
ncbi:MAG: hypothetical protein ACE5GB_01555 [Acidimicrobiales bacterium]